jgi:hypothetical protein
MSLLELFVSVDDFCQQFKVQFSSNPLPASEKKTRNRPTVVTYAEIMTILVHFHQAGYRNFKAFYCLQSFNHFALRISTPSLGSPFC